MNNDCLWHDMCFRFHIKSLIYKRAQTAVQRYGKFINTEYSLKMHLNTVDSNDLLSECSDEPEECAKTVWKRNNNKIWIVIIISAHNLDSAADIFTLYVCERASAQQISFSS